MGRSHSQCGVRIRRAGRLPAARAPEEGGAQPHTRSQSGAPVLGRGLCIPSGCENQGDCARVRQRAARGLGTPQGASTDSLAQELIRSVLRAETALETHGEELN